MRFPEDPSTCFRVDVIEQCVVEVFQENVPADHLERCITTSSHAHDFNNSAVCESHLPFVSEEFSIMYFPWEHCSRLHHLAMKWRG